MSSSVLSSSSTVSSHSSASSSSSTATSDHRTWCFAEKLSEAFCEGVEQQFSCSTNGRQDQDDEQAIENKITAGKDGSKDASSRFNFAEYHKSKISEKRFAHPKKDVKQRRNDKIQGNHRGWGASKSTRFSSEFSNKFSKKTRASRRYDDDMMTDEESGDFSDESFFGLNSDAFNKRDKKIRGTPLVDDLNTDESHDEYTDYDSCEDTCDDTLENTYDETDEIRSYRQHFDDNSTYATSVYSLGRESNGSVLSGNDSRNDSIDNAKHQHSSNSLERDLPSFGSRSNIASHNRSFESQVQYSKGQESLSSFVATYGKTSLRPSHVTPKEVSAEKTTQRKKKEPRKQPTVHWEDSSLPIQQNTAQIRGKVQQHTEMQDQKESKAKKTTSPNKTILKTSKVSKKSSPASVVRNRSDESNNKKKIALGKSRYAKSSTSNIETGETEGVGIERKKVPATATAYVRTSSKTFPFIVNHSLFHHNHNLRKARINQRRSGE